MVPGPSVDLHHLVPKTFKGRETVRMHRICHRKIHSVLTERELAKQYNTIERLLSLPALQRFVTWVQRKHPEYMDRHDRTAAMRRKKRRR